MAYVNISASIAGTGTLNQYKMTVTVSSSSTGVHNYEGQIIYAVIGSSNVVLARTTLSGGVFGTSGKTSATYEYTFSVSSTTTCYARTTCTKCYDGNCPTGYDPNFYNSSSAMTATYTNPVSAPTNAKATITADTSQGGKLINGVAEGRVIVSASCSNPSGATLSYRYCWKLANAGSSAWTYSNWISSSSAGYTLPISDSHRGQKYEFKVNVSNSAGETGWSSSAYVTANALPTNPGTPYPTQSYVKDSVTFQWTESTDSTCDLKYLFELSKNGGSYSSVGWCYSGGGTVDISGDSVGTTYRCRITAYDSFDKTSSSMTSTSYATRGRKPSAPVISSPAANTGHNSSVTLSWSASDFYGMGGSYEVYYSTNGGSSWSKYNTTSSTSMSISIADFSGGTTLHFKVRAINGLNQTTDSASRAIVVSYPPSAPTISAPSNNSIHEGNFNVTWGGSNFYNVSGSYEVQYKTTGDWTAYYSGSGTTKAFTISSIDRGASVSFRARAKNTYSQTSSWSSTITAKRNRIPNAVTNIAPSGYQLGAINITWTGATDPDSHTVTYDLQMSKNGADYTSVKTGATSPYSWTVPTADPGGTTYRFKVISKDTLGATNSATGSLITKPTPPSAPTSVQPGDGYYEGKIRFSWTHSNWYSQTGNYEIRIYDNGTLLRTETVAHNVNYYDFSLANTTRGNKITYDIRAVNSFGQVSSRTSNSSNMRHNRIPGAPSIELPLTNKTVYSQTPKLVIKSASDADGQKMRIYVKWNGTTYNSVDNSSFFSKEKLGNTEYVIFKTTAKLNVGDNTVQVWSNDGLINSSSTSIVIKVASSLATVNTEDYITAAKHNEIITALTNTRAAYGMTKTNTGAVTAGTSYIFDSYFDTITADITALHTKIDGYHADNKLKYTTTFVDPTAGTSYVFASYYNQLINAINNI